ncbi:hypothetical protein cypCar_00007868 [Cyprinus carpio]|nr:hypothetical protein cypCar_00007868 [Cyprinus carpio]
MQGSVKRVNLMLQHEEKEKIGIDGKKTKWNEEINGLKQKLQDQSPVCAFVKKDANIKDLCPQIQTVAQA